MTVRRRARWMLAAMIAAAGVPAGVAGDGAAPAEAPVAVAGRARFLMGTRLSIEARGAGAGTDASAAIERAFDEVARLESLLSNWRPDSEVSRVNRAAAAGPVPVSADFYAAVSVALAWAATTGGTFDPTVEPLVRRLGLRGREGILPGAGEPPGAGPEGAAPVGWRGVRLDPARGTVGFATAGMGLDFGGIGKGMALDAAARVLRRSGVVSALLDFGGQVLVFGPGPDSGGWRVGVADPGDRDRAVDAVLLECGSIATSGNSERAVVVGGRRIGHIIDPRSGGPVEWDGSVTVLAGDATAADALSKALFVLGPERGTAWAEERGIQVLFLGRDDGGRLVRQGAGALFHQGPTGGPLAGGMTGGKTVRVPTPASREESR